LLSPNPICLDRTVSEAAFKVQLLLNKFCQNAALQTHSPTANGGRILEYYLGIDISKETFDAFLLDGDKARHRTFSNSSTGSKKALGVVVGCARRPAARLHESNGKILGDFSCFLVSTTNL
jgi:hypothetical protein